MFKIEKGIALPANGSGRGKSELRLCLESLTVGDSVFVAGVAHRTRSTVAIVKEATGNKYATRNESLGLRVWRIS